MHPILIYIITIVIFILVDAPYLYFNADLYKNRTLAISGKGYTKRYYSAVLVYIALALGIYVLVLPRIRSSNSTSWKDRLQDAVIYGGAFGLASYATFDFTMHFMFEKWDLGVSIMDSIWGGVLCSIVAFIISYL
jgi:uncharacterized membrane protein